MIHSDSPFCEIVSRKNYFTTEIVTMDFLLVQLHFTIRHLDLYKHADIAMYSVKRSGKNRYEFYSDIKEQESRGSVQDRV